jgi:glycosyltransferase involved in cell wall biosynthesis
VTEKPKLVFVHPSNELYGADRVLLVSVEVARRDFDVEVWLPTDIHFAADALGSLLREQSIAVRYVNLPVLRRANLNLRGLVQLLGRTIATFLRLSRARPQVVYVNTTALAIMVPIARLLGRKVITHVHESLEGVTRLIMRALLAPSHELLFVSRATQRSFEGKAGAGKVLYNGFDLEGPYVPAHRGPLTLLMASRWNAWKGHSEFIECLCQVECDDVRVLILGGPPISGASVDVPNLLASSPMRPAVKVVGEVSDVSPHLKDCHAVVVPSARPDPLPTIAIEAMAAGRAVLCTPVGGLTEIVTDGVEGWYLRVAEPKQWAGLIDRLTVDDAIEAGRRARHTYESKFAGGVYRRELAAILEPLL